MVTVTKFSRRKRLREKEIVGELTPEEEKEKEQLETALKKEKAIEEGQAFIAEREKRLAGIEIPSQPEEKEALKKEVLTTERIAEEIGAVKQPEKRELSPEKELEGMPLGATVGALTVSFRKDIQAQKQFQEELKTIDEEAKTFPLEQQQIFINARRKTLFNERIIEKRRAFQEQFKILLEGIPIAPKIARKFGIKLGTPSDKVDDLKSNLAKLEDEIIFAEDIAIDTPKEAIKSLNLIESRISELESRIQQQIIISPELRANPEEVDDIEADILRQKRNLFNARNAIALIVTQTT